MATFLTGAILLQPIELLFRAPQLFLNVSINVLAGVKPLGEPVGVTVM
jgi:hypothetical protein